MKRYLSAGFVLLMLSACNEKPAVQSSTADTTVVKDTIPAAEPVNVSDSWKATLESSGNKKAGKLVVTGIINLKKNAPKPVLTLKKPTGVVDLSELVLSLSQEPVNDGKATTVKYQESVARADKYNKVRIMYKDKEVAVINTIDAKH